VIKLDDDTKAQLRQLQKQEREKRRHVKITVLLMLDGGFSAEEIAYSFGIDDATVYRYAESYRSSKELGDYLQDKYLIYDGKLSEEQITLLKQELGSRLYRSCKEIAAFIKRQWGIAYTPTGLVPLLGRIGFVYKQTKQVPSKADAEAQEQFLASVKQMLETEPENQHIYYVDAVHPQHNTRRSMGWIERGKDFTVKSNSGRERLNINGAVNAHHVTDIVVREDERINAQSTIELYKQLQRRHPRGKIIVICDNAKYYRSKLVKQWLSTSRVEQLFLPIYSPNLNLIERLWKFLRKKVIDAEYYSTKELFREAVMGFFKEVKNYKSELESLLTLNFRVLDSSHTA